MKRNYGLRWLTGIVVIITLLVILGVALIRGFGEKPEEGGHEKEGHLSAIGIQQ